MAGFRYAHGIIRFPRKRFNLLTLSINAFGIDLSGFTASS
jgi:hypothetical protein